jgi:hypothetical protein
MTLIAFGASAETISFADEQPGGPSAKLEAVIGEWRIADLGGHRGLLVDGSKWKQGTPSASLADQARRLYGDRYAEFLDGVKAFAYYPLAVYKGDCPGNDLLMSVKFYPNEGRIDQGAGLAWSVMPDGSYWGVRANALEDNLLFFHVVRGKRHVLKTVRGIETTTKTWHTLKAEFHGAKIRVWLDDKSVLERGLDAPVSGRCGLWSKADSQVLFDEFTVAKP